MIGLLRSEVRKLRTVWSTYVLLGITAVIIGALSSAVGFAPSRRDSITFLTRGSVFWFDRVFSIMSTATSLALVLGVLMITSEYRHKTVTPTFLVEPRRELVTTSKLVVALGGGAVVAIVAGAVSLIFGASVVAGGIGSMSTMLTEYRHVFPGVAAAAVLFAVYGVGLGALLKNQVVAVLVGIVFTAVVEPIIDGVWPAVGRWLPGQAAQALESVTAQAAVRGADRALHLLAWWNGALVLLAYGVVLAAAGSFTTLRADVT